MQKGYLKCINALVTRELHRTWLFAQSAQHIETHCSNSKLILTCKSSYRLAPRAFTNSMSYPLRFHFGQETGICSRRSAMEIACACQNDQIEFAPPCHLWPALQHLAQGFQVSESYTKFHTGRTEPSAGQNSLPALPGKSQ